MGKVRRLTPTEKEHLIQTILRNEDKTEKEICKKYFDEYGSTVSQPTVSRYRALIAENQGYGFETSNGINCTELKKLQRFVKRKDTSMFKVFPTKYVFDTGIDNGQSGRVMLLEVNPIFIDEVIKYYSKILTRRYLYDITSFGCQIVFFILPSEIPTSLSEDRYCKIANELPLEANLRPKKHYLSDKEFNQLLSFDDIKNVILMGTEYKRKRTKKRIGQ